MQRRWRRTVTASCCESEAAWLSPSSRPTVSPLRRAQDQQPQRQQTCDRTRRRHAITRLRPLQRRAEEPRSSLPRRTSCGPRPSLQRGSAPASASRTIHVICPALRLWLAKSPSRECSCSGGDQWTRSETRDPRGAELLRPRHRAMEQHCCGRWSRRVARGATTAVWSERTRESGSSGGAARSADSWRAARTRSAMQRRAH